ncbi:YccF domain-containing protein [Pseudonocardia acaciae]|uniref:YccF domain-containing protein n=1 Tax=Pseudonocardia acaciae TaxID=551276 RepID=UPI00048BE31E|nr:YccF domain-containing protein [Pseudonocardia acaciae]
MLRTLLNVIWLVLCGIWMALGYVLAGVICCLLVVTIPFGLASFRIANFALWPFGRTLVPRPHAGAPSTIGNVIWFLVAGWWLALGHVITAISLAVTIIGIPLALANLKLIPVSLVPLGKEIVPTGGHVPGGYQVTTTRP